ncbi:putative bifunctional diguanylate cyclase/phosphodiesterase [Motiliproteus sediminis]|uniref:putative bifunctional diguanylate cyclase/phosphodiesterase n=1 Tax=Motiliproteus sediminis TaxID=1468178 RepID=UPI001AEF4058|nr:EAL domain-containing protein [Motiliproteus sediminis]
MTGFPLRIAVLYAVFAAIWIAVSDQAVEVMFPGSALAQSYKGWFFVVVTSVLLYSLLRQEMGRRQLAESALQHQQEELEKLSLAVSQSPVSVIVSDIEGHIEYVNPAFEQMTGYSRDEALGSNPRIFNSGKTPKAVYDELWQTIRGGDAWEGELMNQRKDGHTYWVHARISPVTGDQGQVSHFLAIEEDITLRKAQEHQIRHQANYDSLTELPNRFLAMDRMSQAINAAIRHDQTVVLMFIDLDNFKQINDSLGHDVGDQLITLAAGRIRETVRQTDTVARYGGDEFLVILTSIDTSDDASRVAEKVLTSLASPYRIDGRELALTASIGMAVFPEDGQDPYELLRHADAAMFGAKDEGGNRYEFHSAAINDAAVERMEVEQQLRRALEKRELSLHYQPLVDVASGKINAAEVLLRWDNPDLGRVAPDRFIPLAEATGLIIPIGEWVIRTACSQLRSWLNEGITDLKLAINLSPRQFNDPHLLRVVTQALEENELRGEQIELEITEGVLMRNQEDARRTLEKLRGLGIRISLDDFGTGYSSLSYLKRFPFDSLKIDRSFITDVLEESEDQALVRATLTMASGLGLSTVGEGVETREQLRFLNSEGVASVQGFYFSQALPAAEFKQYYLNFRPEAVNS